MSRVLIETTLTGERVAVPVNFKNYTVVRRIGVGASAVIFEVRDVNTDQRLAAKIMSHSVTGQEHEFREREVRLCTEISHPCLVNVVEVIRLKRVTIIVMELCKEGDLVTRMETDIDDVLDRGCVIFRQVCLAVQYLHERGLAHRDLKLENILLVNDTEVKLCDYGLMCEPGNGGMSITRCGTVAYMAPEVMQGRRYCPKKADVWSLGILFHTMMTQSLPYESDVDEDIVKEALSGGLYFDNMTPDLASVMMRLCCSDPEERATIDEVLEMPLFKYPVDYREKMSVEVQEECRQIDDKEQVVMESKSHPLIHQSRAAIEVIDSQIVGKFNVTALLKVDE